MHGDNPASLPRRLQPQKINCMSPTTGRAYTGRCGSIQDQDQRFLVFRL